MPENSRVFIGIAGRGTFKFLNVIPGPPEGAKLWNEYSKKVLEKCGFEEVATGVFKSECSTLIKFIDDILASGGCEQTISDLKGYLKLEEPQYGFPSKFLGLSFENEDSTLCVSMQSYFDSLEGLEGTLPTNYEFEKEEINKEKIQEAQAAVCKLAWAANTLHHLKFASSIILLAAYIPVAFSVEIIPPAR